MNELNDRDILRRMHSLTRLEPTLEQTDRALAAVRRAIFHRTLMRYSITTALAAAIVIATTVGIFSLTPGSARAADALAQATTASTTYRGWIHTRSETEGQPGYTIQHVNNQTGVFALEAHGPSAAAALLMSGNGLVSENTTSGPDGLAVQMWVPGERLDVNYNSNDRTIRKGQVNEQFAVLWKAQMQNTPLTVNAQIAKGPDVRVEQSKDGALDRYEITLPPEDPAKPRDKNTQAANPEKVVMWADPATKLIQRGEMVSAGETEKFTVTYGPPDIKEIYDLGVPRDAKVIDLRPSNDVESLFKRLQTHVDQAWGDYVGIYTEQDADEIGKPTDAGGALCLGARQGKHIVWKRYLFGNSTDLKGNIVARHPPAPKGWPSPTLDDALAAIKDQIPGEYLVWDGVRGATGFHTSQDTWNINKLEGDMIQSLPMIKARFSLEGQTWPTRNNMGLFGTGAKSQVITDKDKPGLIGLKIEQTYPGEEMKPTKSENLIWLDPAKDDLPVQRLSITYQPASDKVQLRFDFQDYQFARTSTGKWYPARWLVITSSESPTQYKLRTDTRLSIWTDRKLPPQLLAQPETTQPAAPTAPTAK